MSKRHFFLAAMVVATPVIAQESRELDAHVHGVSELNMAFAGNQIAVELHAPGFDIVGFEYVAESAEDLAAVEAALATLANPLDLFVFPEAAGCSVLSAEVALLQEDDDHDDHDHDAHDHDEHDDHDHDDHAENDDHDHGEHAEHDDHDHDDHADEGHDDHDHGDHAEHDEHDHEDHGDHDRHDHDDHAEDGGATHSEFQADYLLSCSDIDAVDAVTMAFFDVFETSQDLEVVIFTASGGQSFELDRETPVLDLSDAL